MKAQVSTLQAIDYGDNTMHEGRFTERIKIKYSINRLKGHPEASLTNSWSLKLISPDKVGIAEYKLHAFVLMLVWPTYNTAGSQYITYDLYV